MLYPPVSLRTLDYAAGIVIFSETYDISYEIEQDADVVCQPGVGWMQLNETLQNKGRHIFSSYFSAGTQVNLCS